MKTTIQPIITTKNRMETKFNVARGNITGHLLSWAAMKRPPWRRGFVLIALILTAFALSPQARATCQEGCLTNFNTVLGDDALLNNTGNLNTAIGAAALINNTSGYNDTASGAFALAHNIDGYNNTATGFNALYNNTGGSDNTATGVFALFSNIGSVLTGFSNTATGANALRSNTAGNGNTATGSDALRANTTGNGNTATGGAALQSNIGSGNTATGGGALQANTTGGNNTASGYQALEANTTGRDNTATGVSALLGNIGGSENTANGEAALLRNTGSYNIALGYWAGSNLTTGSHNIDIGNPGVAAENSKIRIGTVGTHNGTFIAGIYNVAVTGSTVAVNSNGRLGVIASSARFKEAIKPMDKASEAILALKPVTFRYKKEIDEAGIPQFGLVAEEVEKVDPNLVSRDADGKAYTVRYDAVNAMLLNEFQKAHRKIEEQRTMIARQQEQIEALTAGLQKVNDKIELSKPAPQTVLNNQ
jgi:hypothetical protein